MRTTIDIPDRLFERAKTELARRQMTLRAVVVDALERMLVPEPQTFQLRDASVGGYASGRVSNDAINRAIDDFGEPTP
jgi:hypothetical protein